MLKTKVSRIIFACGIVVSFILIHFSDALVEDGLEFSQALESMLEHPIALPLYLGLLFGIPLVASVVLPLIIKWIKSGE